MITQTTANSRKIPTAGSISVAKRDPKRLVFTKNLLGNLPLPTNAQRSYFYDSRTPGLALAVTPKGKKVFILYRKISGRPERITIGPFPDLTIDQARRKAAELKGAIAGGDNPAARRRAVRDEWTLQELFTKYLEEHLKFKKKKTWREREELFNLHLGAWKLRKISEIRKDDVERLHRRIGEDAPYAANRTVELLRSVFNSAIDKWNWDGKNPAAKIEPFEEHSRERFLLPEEVPNFFQALGEESNETVRDFFFLALLTGARRANVQAMRWEEVSFQTATWKIPASTSKSGESVTVALSFTAMSILKERKKSSESEWVFPGTGSNGHLIEPKSGWKRILKRAGIEDLRIHDLRRTLGSWQAAAGASLPIIGKSLGHRSLAATQVYARLNLDPVRESVNKATDALLLAAKGPVKLLGGGNG